MCTCFNRDFRQKLYTFHNNKPRRKKTHIIIGYAQQFQFLKSSNKRETISNYGKNRWQNKVTKSGKHTVRSEFRKNENKSVFHKTGDYKQGLQQNQSISSVNYLEKSTGSLRISANLV